jgi:hemerythrin-like metal-binding protein
MAFLDWNTYFETGSDIVDARHRYLVDLINQASSVLAEAGDTIPAGGDNQLQELFRYADVHFCTEEGLMHSNGLDPRHVEHHLGAQRGFVRQVQALVDLFTQLSEQTGNWNGNTITSDRHTGLLRFEVSDTGIGIEPEAMDER